jgi:hypothetical protein
VGVDDGDGVDVGGGEGAPPEHAMTTDAMVTSMRALTAPFT